MPDDLAGEIAELSRRIDQLQKGAIGALIDAQRHTGGESPRLADAERYVRRAK